MVVWNVIFKRTPKYEEIVDKLKGGANIYLQGAVCTGKSTMVNELQYDLDIKYCYVDIPSDVQCTTLNVICERIANKFDFQVEKDCRSGVSTEGTLTAIREMNEKVLFVFDDISNIQYAHPGVSEDINEWLHDLCLIEGCQVVCVGQTSLNGVLPHFFSNKSWRTIFDVVSVEDNTTNNHDTDIKSVINCWLSSELARGEYPPSLLKLISMGVGGEMSLCDAVKAASVFC